MNITEFIASLEKKNGFCSCEELAELFRLSRTAKELEKRCDNLGAEINLNKPQEEENRKFLETYRDSAYAIDAAIENYYQAVNSLLDSRKLVLRVREPSSGLAGDYLNGRIKSRKRAAPVTTIHCSGCSQQIDVLDGDCIRA